LLSANDDRARARPDHHQAGESLNISRGSVYYCRPVPEADLAIMRRLTVCI
jgi:hypothetical protein